MIKLLSTLFIIASLSGCATNDYKNFYSEYADPKTLPNLEELKPGQEPELYTSNNLGQDVLTMRSKGYAVIGESAFNADHEDPAKAIMQAKAVGATVILVNVEYTNTESSTTPLLLPNNQTTYFAGGAATTYGTVVVPISSNTRRYDQFGVYFAKWKEKARFGIQGRDLTPVLRRELERNTGMLIEVVVEDTPAFDANVIAGDVLIEVNGKTIRDYDAAAKILGAVPESAESAVITIIRNGEEEDITVTF